MQRVAAALVFAFVSTSSMAAVVRVEVLPSRAAAVTIKALKGTTVNCDPGPRCEAPAESGKYRVTVRPAANARFVEWAGECAGQPADGCALDVGAAGNVRILAFFLVDPTRMTVTPPTMGAIQAKSVDSGKTIINCGGGTAICTAEVSKGGVVQLTASAGADAIFSSWSGACQGTSASCSIALDKPLTVGADFKKKVTLTINAPQGGQVWGDKQFGTGKTIECGNGGTRCQASFEAGTKVILNSAVPTLWSFSAWSGACSGNAATCLVTLDTPKQVSASFTYGGATITLQKNAGGMIDAWNSQGFPAQRRTNLMNCGRPGPEYSAPGINYDTCVTQVAKGTPVSVYYRPNSLKKTRWAGACAGQPEGNCNISVNGDIAISVVPVYVVTVSAPQNGKVTFAGQACPGNCSLTTESTQSVTFKAIPDSGAVIGAWSGPCSGVASDTCTVPVAGNLNVGVTFAR